MVYNTAWLPFSSFQKLQCSSPLSLLPLPSFLPLQLVQPFLINLIKAGTIKPTANTYYPIHFAPGISITQGGGASCAVFCVYHGTIDISSLNVGTKYLFYGVIPDQGGSCAGGCGSNPSQINNMFSVASHELAEAVTDAAVGVSTTIGAPLAWYDQTNGENGDICNAQQGTTVGADGVTYVVQKTWSNADNACVAATSGGGGGTACAHSKCVTGVALRSTCDACVGKIVAADSYCGSTSWDSTCVGEVKSVCGITC